MKPRRPRLFEIIAEQLKKEIEEKNYSVLPAFDELCQDYKVSLVTISQAVHELEKRGICKVYHGKGTLVLGKKQVPQSMESVFIKTSAGRLYTLIKERIEDGTYKTGNALPKSEYFSHTRHVSIMTVFRALLMLEKKQLIHKVGKLRIVGRPGEKTGFESTFGGFLHHEGPVVLVLVYAYDEVWEDWYQDIFNIAFLRILGNAGIEARICQCERQNILTKDIVVTGREGILSLIQKLGTRYKGTLFISKVSHFDECRDWIEWMCQFRKPVIWHDRGGNPETFDRKIIRKKEFIRCKVDFEKLVQLPLEVLYELGHRKIGALLPDSLPPFHWISKRLDSIKKHAESFTPPLSLVVQTHSGTLWEYNWHSVVYGSLDKRMLECVDAIADSIKKNNPQISKVKFEQVFKNKLVQAVPFLARLVREQNITALIGMDIYFSGSYYHWLHAFNIAIPKRLSLIGFADSPFSSPIPVSSVDPQLDNLGYCAAHVIIGDIPVRTDRWGNIVSTPKIVNKGSLGPVYSRF